MNQPPNPARKPGFLFLALACLLLPALVISGPINMSGSRCYNCTGGGGGSGAPTPSGTIVFDARAGGAQSFASVRAVTDGTTSLASQCAQRIVTANGSTAYGPAFTASAGGRWQQ